MNKDLGMPPLPIGGWLVFIAIGLIGSCLREVVGFIQFFKLGINPFLTIMEAIMIALLIVNIIYFFKRSKVFIALHIALRAYIVFVYLLIVIEYYSPTVSSYLILNVIWSAVWITYLLCSKRVKRTFVYAADGTMQYNGPVSDYEAQAKDEEVKPYAINGTLDSDAIRQEEQMGEVTQQPADTVTCPKCGANIMAQSVFCKKCGAKL